MTLALDLQDWVIITSALGAAFSPLYYFMLKIEKNVASVSATVSCCPYCQRRFEKGVKK